MRFQSQFGRTERVAGGRESCRGVAYVARGREARRTTLESEPRRWRDYQLRPALAASSTPQSLAEGAEVDLGRSVWRQVRLGAFGDAPLAGARSTEMREGSQPCYCAWPRGRVLGQ